MTKITMLNGNKYFTNERISDIYYKLKYEKLTTIELTDGSIIVHQLF